MATYYPPSNDQRDVFTNPYLPSQQLDSYQESSPFPPINMMYPNQTSNDSSFLELLSQPMPQMLSRVKQDSLDDEHNLQYQELSLSLGMQMPSSSMELPAFQYGYKNPGSMYLLSSHLPDSGERVSQGKVENPEYLSFGLVGGAHDTSTNEHMNSSASISDTYELSGLAPKFFNTRYLKPAQELLDEIVNLREALRQLKAVNKQNNYHKPGLESSEENDLKFNCQSVHSSVNGKSDPHDSTTTTSSELTPSERQDLQCKVTKLLFMLDEVDRRYREYYQQLQIVESTLEMVAGCGAAKPYTGLALHTISRQFRCLRDGINAQIRKTRQILGDQEDNTPNSNPRVLPRLRNVEKQLRQERTLYQFGVTCHSWRPQRGLPESSVSILRAWLFEHFLDPYPKDSEKIMLAKQTGLTRSQIANWFINARVRLWKPMVEDMYKEEFGVPEENCKSSPEHAPPKAPKGSSSSSSEDNNRINTLQTATTFAASLNGHGEKSSNSNPNLINNTEMNAYTENLVDQYRFSDPQMLADFLA